MSRLTDALIALGEKVCTEDANLSGDKVENVIEEMAKNHSIILVSPDKSVWDLKIANDGTISATKRT